MRRRVLLSMCILTALVSACGDKPEPGPGPGTQEEPGSGGEGSVGPRGEPGPKGDTGPAGPPGNFARIRVVPPGDNPKIGGENLRNALQSIVKVSADEPWLVFLEPGVYDLGAQGLRMRSFIHLQGSGQGLTTVRSSASGATLEAEENSELSALTVEHVGGGEEALALSTGTPTFRAKDVVAVARDGTRRTVAIRSSAGAGSGGFERVQAMASSSQGDTVGFSCEGCAVKLSGSSVLAKGGARALGVSVQRGTLELWDSFATGTGGASESVGVDAVGSTLGLVRTEVSGSEGGASTGLRLNSSPATIRDGTLSGSGPGGRQAIALDVSRSDGGSYTVDVLRTTLTGASNSVRSAPGLVVRIAGSQFRGGGQVDGNGSVSCNGSFNENLQSPVAPACP